MYCLRPNSFAVLLIIPLAGSLFASRALAETEVPAEELLAEIEYDDATIRFMLGTVKRPQAKETLGLSDDQASQIKEITREEYARQVAKRRELNKKYPRASAGSDRFESDAYEQELIEFQSGKPRRQLQHLKEILTGMQIEMLWQFSILTGGVGSISRESVQRELGLNEIQIGKIRKAIDELRTAGPELIAMHRAMGMAGTRTPVDVMKQKGNQIYKEHREQFEKDIFEILDGEQERTFRKMIDKAK